MTDVRSILEGKGTQFQELWKAGNVEEIANMYTEDCKVMPPGFPTCTGREAVKAVLGSLAQGGITKMKTETEEVLDLGDYAIERSYHTHFNPDDSVKEKGKYLIVWKKVDGDYYLHMVMFNGDAV